jgi:phycocyanobilin lyase subunit alpha
MSDDQAPVVDTTMTEWTVERAIANLQSPDLSQRYYAAWWLGKMRIDEAIDPLLVAIEDQEDRTDLGGYPLRRNAARALGKLQNPKAIPALMRSLSCEDFYVREAAAQAIATIAMIPEGYIVAQVCIPPLKELLQSGESLEGNEFAQPYEAILEALGRLKANSAKSQVETFLDYQVPRIRLAAARAMYGITGEQAFAEQLVKGLKSPDVNLQQAALIDLGEIGYLPSVQAIAHCDVENSFKLFALRSIVNAHLPKIDQEQDLMETLQQVMLLMDDLL